MNNKRIPRKAAAKAEIKGMEDLIADKKAQLNIVEQRYLILQETIPQLEKQLEELKAKESIGGNHK